MLAPPLYVTVSAVHKKGHSVMPVALAPSTKHCEGGFMHDLGLHVNVLC